MTYESNPKELKDVFKDIDKNKLLLPNFQRKLEWGKNKQKSLLASFFVGLPIGSFLFLESPKDEYPSKALGEENATINYDQIKSEEVNFLLDGQQRITTLKSIFTDFFKDSENKKEFKKDHEDTFPVLRRRWFINIKKGKDFFGFAKPRFNEYKYKSTKPEDIIEMFEFEKINRGDQSNGSEKWYNPLYKFKNQLTETQYKDVVIKNAAKEKRIPLFYLIESISKSEEDKIDYKDTVIYKILIKIVMNKYDLKIAEDKNMLIEVSDWARDVYDYFKKCITQKLHIIEVPMEERDRAIPIFENINSGGTPLDIFDLIVAKAADMSKDINKYDIYTNETESLRDAIKRELEIVADNYKDFKTHDMIKLPNKWSPKTVYFDNDNNIYKEFKTRYLSLLSLICHIDNYDSINDIKGDYFKKSSALDLDSEEINKNTFNTVKALIKSGQFLQFRCGILNINKLSYGLMLLPIAYIMLDNQSAIYKSKEKLNLLEFWYWFSLFCGIYRDNKNKRCIKDIKLLHQVLIKDNIEAFKFFIEEYKDRFLNFDDYSDEDTLVNNNDVPNAISSTIEQYILSKCPEDFLDQNKRISAWDIAQDNIKVEFHHVIPLGLDLENKIENSEKKLRDDKKHILNSPLNITPILKGSNNKISNISIKDYLPKLSNMAKDKHCLPDDCIINNYKMNENFYKEFLEKRFSKLKDKIKNEFQNLLSHTNINISLD